MYISSRVITVMPISWWNNINIKSYCYKNSYLCNGIVSLEAFCNAPLTLSIATRIFFFCAAVKGSKSIWLPLDFLRKRPSSCLSRHSMRPGSGRRLRKSRMLRRFHWSISCKFSKCTTFTRCELHPASPSSSELNQSM